MDKVISSIKKRTQHLRNPSSGSSHGTSQQGPSQKPSNCSTDPDSKPKKASFVGNYSKKQSDEISSEDGGSSVETRKKTGVRTEETVKMLRMESTSSNEVPRAKTSNENFSDFVPSSAQHLSLKVDRYSTSSFSKKALKSEESPQVRNISPVSFPQGSIHLTGMSETNEKEVGMRVRNVIVKTPWSSNKELGKSIFSERGFDRLGLDGLCPQNTERNIRGSNEAMNQEHRGLLDKSLRQIKRLIGTFHSWLL